MTRIQYLTILLISVATLNACAIPSDTPSGSNLSEAIDICQTKVSLGLNLDQAASAPVFVFGELDFESLGKEGAEKLLNELTNQDTFCDIEIPDSFQAYFDDIEAMAGTGEVDQAQELLDDIFETINTVQIRSAGRLAVQNPFQDDRENIRIFIEMAQWQMFLGTGDGSTYMNAARNVFQKLAEKELERSQINATMRLTQEAQLLGEKEIAEKAIEKSKQIIEEALEAAINDLDPCITNPTILEADIRKMFDLLAKAMMLGVEAAWQPGTPLYDLSLQKALQTARQIAHLEAPDLIEPPEECLGFTFSFNRIVSGAVTMNGSALTCSTERGPWSGQISLDGSPEPGFTLQAAGEFEFTVPEDQSYVEVLIPTSGTAQILSGNGIISDDLLFTFQLMGDGTAEVTILSTGSGQIIVQAEGLTYPVPHFGTVWTEEPTFSVTLERIGGCK
jgi:hypothetical protein